MKFEGRIVENNEFQYKPRFMVDADPHVMQRIRKIFDNAQSFWTQGNYTHKPILFPINLSACRDLVWLMDRYTLDVSPELLKTIKEKSEEYERIIKSVSDADKDSDYRISEDALKLALPLRTHQIQFNNMFSKVKKMLLADKMGLGKAQPLTSNLVTPEGLIKMGDVKVGDLVIGSDGNPIKILGVFPQGKQKIYKITFTDNTTVRCSEDHLWEVSTAHQRHRGTGGTRVLTTLDILKNISGPKKNNNTKYFIKTVKPINFKDRDVPIDPYFLGLLLGDGGITASVKFTSADEELLEKVRKLIYPKYELIYSSQYDYRITLKECVGGRNSNAGKGKHEIKNSLVSLGLFGLKSGKKFIPDVYLYNSVEKRIAILQGLMDTDGFVDKDGYVVQFSSASERLVDNVCFLIQSLGGIARKKYKKTCIDTDHWIVTISLPPNIIPVTFKRKLDRYKPKTKYLPVKGIKNIEEDGYEECQCIKVDSKDSLYVTDNCILTHNTSSAISILCEPERRPALIVVPTTLCTQWEREIKRFLPEASTHVIRGFKNYDLPQVDVLITSYNRLAPWQDVLLDGNKFKTLILDEVHEVRHTGTGKRHVVRSLASRAEYCAGLSGTPIFNYGNEIWAVLDAIKPECLGDLDDFESEWCSWGKVLEPSTLNHYLKQQGLFLRRSPEDVGLTFGECSKHVFTLDADLEKLKEVQNVAKMLALSVLSGNIGEDSESAREFDFKLRQATGIAKAKPVAEFVKMLVESGEKVVLAGWHRDVYEIWEKELASLNPVMFTGSETPKQKEQSVDKFVKGDSKVFIISLRSGAGLDGLQHACNTVVFGELDWTGNVHDQVIARVDRDGQTKHVQAYYLTIADGSDPFIVGVLGVKKSQHDGIVEGKQSEGGVITQSTAGKDRIKEMATAYLKSIGEEIPEPVSEEGLLGDLAKLLRNTKLPVNTEEEMQEALNNILIENIKNAKVEREFKIGKRSRLDFLLSDDNSRVAIECKIESTGRTEVYRQVRRYVEEGNITSLILVAPWFGIPPFKVDGVPVIVIDTSINSI